MESQRQKKISILIQKDISNIIQSFFREKVRSTFIVSVTKASFKVLESVKHGGEQVEI